MWHPAGVVVAMPTVVVSLQRFHRPWLLFFPFIADNCSFKPITNWHNYISHEKIETMNDQFNQGHLETKEFHMEGCRNST
jgi:hypothetical protein